MDNIIFYWKEAFDKYADFSGRSRRAEMWYFVLANLLIYLTLAVLGRLLSFAFSSPAPFIISMCAIGAYYLAVIVPSLAVSVRRLHDTGRSGWYYFISLIPFGSIVLLVWFVTEGEPHPNEWGADPKDLGVGYEDHLIDYDLRTPAPQERDLV